MHQLPKYSLRGHVFQIENFLSSLVYEGNHQVQNTLQTRATARSKAYIESDIMKGKELKVQDFIFKSDPTTPITQQNVLPIFSNRIGEREGEVIGSKVFVKEIDLKFYVYQNIAEYQDLLQNPSFIPKDVPNYMIHYALVSSTANYDQNDPNSNVLFRQVFQDLNTLNGSTFSTPYSFKSPNNQHRYTVLCERTLTLGSFNPYPSDANDSSVVCQNKNSGPFDQYFYSHFNLWDVQETSNEVLKEDPNQPIFSEGLEMNFKISDSEDALENQITTGSLWILVRIAPPLSPDNPLAPRVEFYSRCVYTDKS